MTEAAAAPALESRSIVCGYGRAEIVHGVSMQAARGEVVCIVGPNGAGKSTFVKALAGNLRAFSGQTFLEGQDISRLGQEVRTRKGLGYVPQTRDVFPSLTVWENIAMGGYLCRGHELAERRQVVLERFPQLKKVLKSKAGKLSGGERKLVGLARILMSQPKVLLLDEPTAGLSPQYAGIVRRHIRALAEEGQCVVLVEQHVMEALEISDRSLVMVQGLIHHEGDASELRSRTDLGEMFLGRV